MATGSAAPITAASEMRRRCCAMVVREEGGGGRARRAVDRAVDAPLGARLGVPRVQHPHRVGVHSAGGLACGFNCVDCMHFL